MLGTGEATKIEVTFHKGAGSAKNSSFVETVDLLPVGLLRDVIRVALQSDDARQTANIGGYTFVAYEDSIHIL